MHCLHVVVGITFLLMHVTYVMNSNGVNVLVQ